jgi:hypothetical protein
MRTFILDVGWASEEATGSHFYASLSQHGLGLRLNANVSDAAAGKWRRFA